MGLSNTTGAIDIPFGSGQVKGMGTDRVHITPLQFHYHSPSEHTINGENCAQALKINAQLAFLPTEVAE